jgi:hypothetical protein
MFHLQKPKLLNPAANTEGQGFMAFMFCWISLSVGQFSKRIDTFSRSACIVVSKIVRCFHPSPAPQVLTFLSVHVSFKTTHTF